MWQNLGKTFFLMITFLGLNLSSDLDDHTNNILDNVDEMEKEK